MIDATVISSSSCPAGSAKRSNIVTERTPVIHQQDRTDIEPGLDGGVNISQRWSSDGSDHRIGIVGRANLLALIAGLQQLAEVPHD
ncbi:hypothetical protein [Kaistia terrae]|uniref:Uncharacterized protein n=1 Tax=Kaistia terrae TaxID=537017 RepID=A0ABW0PWP8_9HYPH|nr:hypothetical protein [Kaistia terrae]MCX5580526.1 hypothetical protein [Kaistia terrae]